LIGSFAASYEPLSHFDRCKARRTSLWQLEIAMSPFLTSKENIAVNLIYGWLGESRTNRTYDEYVEIASRFPKLTACHAYVNQRLQRMAEAGLAPYGICYFKAGDRYPWYEDFPTSLSREIVRTALLKMGKPQKPRRKH
jgi:hypothetical protein